MSATSDLSYGTCIIASEPGENGRVFVTVAGELDLYTTPLLQQALEQPASEFVVDLIGCEFIDSTALGVLVAARERVGRLALIARGLEVERILQISGLNQILPVYGSRDSVQRSGSVA